MRLILDTTDADFKKARNWTTLNSLLNGGLSLDNLKGELISGETADVSDTLANFPHKFGASAIGGIILLGNVYVSGVTKDFIDVRSPNVNEDFTIFVISER